MWVLSGSFKNVKFCDNDKIKIYADNVPCVGARTILPDMNKFEILDIENKPFINKRNINYIIYYKGKEYVIFIPRNYTWDAMTIPRFAWSLVGLSKESVQGLIASCVHDKICENKYLVGYSRELSTLIFKELCIASNMSRKKANFICFFVDNFQKFNKGWKKCP